MATVRQRKPDFIIAGAMKCGTTWLHDALNSVPGVFIPRSEFHGIDARDILVHPEFSSVTSRGLELARHEDTVWWDGIDDSGESILYVGYDSTTLFHSRIDLKGVASQFPSTKLLVLLRNPVDRSFSHYWHLVRTGRARYRFEKELLFGKREILEKSIYVDQIRRVRSAFGERVHFVCCEKMFEEPELELSKILEFLGLPSERLQALCARATSPSNPGRYPRFLGGWLLASRLTAGFENGRYARDVGPGRHRGVATLRYGAYRAKLAAMVALGAGIVQRQPQMKKTTRDSLQRYLREANTGIDELLGGHWLAWWNMHN